MKIKGLLSRTFACTTMMAVAVGFTATSCDSILDEDDVDCSVEYRVKFKYDYNMKYADAFSREVSSVAL
ncbi:FimB/Mfa2 family fimbrial subunit, partial [uncultured Phocaeicola sp.]